MLGRVSSGTIATIKLLTYAAILYWFIPLNCYAQSSRESREKKNPTIAIKQWTQLPSIPNAVGLAGALAGISNGNLIVGGGANFPIDPPWQGGTKTWHDSVYVLGLDQLHWKTAGKLPRPLAYSTCLTIPTGLNIGPGVVCIGGSDSNRHYSDCFVLRWQNDQLQLESLPELPKRTALASAVILDGIIYCVGGIENPLDTQAMNSFLMLDLNRPGAQWTELPTPPGPGRILSVMATDGKSILLFSGVALNPGTNGQVVRTYLTDCHSYRKEDGWKQCASMPRASAAAPSPAICQHGWTYILGGDDGSRVGFKPEENHPGFAKDVLRYSAALDQWQIDVEELPCPHVTTPQIPWMNGSIIASGEMRPGVRSPSVWMLRMDP